jgi:dTDP-4-dehydrorhamnose reductase
LRIERLAREFHALELAVREMAIMRIVLTGASGQLGAYLVDQLLTAGHDVDPWTGETKGTQCRLAFRPIDLRDDVKVQMALAEEDPDVVLHAAAMSGAEAVRRDPEQGNAVNVEATWRLARWCRDRGRRIVFTSTDLVFDGSQSWYHENDEPRPILVYGRTKLAAEQAVLAGPGGVVARLSLLYGASLCGRQGFFDFALAMLRTGRPLEFFDDEFRTPLDYKTAARALVRLAESDAQGVVHVGGRERVSRFELMSRAARVLGIDASLARANRRENVTFVEPRPADVSLDTSRLQSLFPDLDRPAIEEALLST